MGGFFNPGLGPRARPTPQEEADAQDAERFLSDFFSGPTPEQQESDFVRMWGPREQPRPTPTPAPMGAQPAAAPPVRAEAPPQSRGPALKAPAEEASNNPRAAFFQAAARRGGATAPAEGQNPSGESIREKLGFRWGKDVQLDPATGRPAESSGPLFGLAEGAQNAVPVVDIPSAHEDQVPGGYVMAGGDRGGVPYLPPSAVEETEGILSALTGQRDAARLKTGVGAAPATAAELLEDQRRNEREYELTADRDQKLKQAEAMLAAGRYSTELYQQAVSDIKREHAMATGRDPRYFTYQ